MASDTPLVSIIIPTYNRAHLIGQALDSILLQTYQNWECIVVDDGSTDNTEEALIEYLKNDTHFQYYQRPSHKPKGANACRNYGYEKSKGVFIQWFDSDDVMHPENIKIKVEGALTHLATIIVAAHTNKKQEILPKTPKIEVFSRANFYVDYILGNRALITNDVMIKKSILGALRFDEKLQKAQEYEFFTRLFNQDITYCFIDLPLTYYRESPDAISKNAQRGNFKNEESLIYLSKKISAKHSTNPAIVAKTERQGRKTYKSLILRRNVRLVIKHFQFFRKCHHKSAIIFAAFIIYNFFTKSGFDVLKPK